MSTGRASRTCLLNSGLPERGVWCKSTAFRHYFVIVVVERRSEGLEITPFARHVLCRAAVRRGQFYRENARQG
jgi:hypothetical protein